jgi:hypothetical protein
MQDLKCAVSATGPSISVERAAAFFRGSYSLARKEHQSDNHGVSFASPPPQHARADKHTHDISLVSGSIPDGSSLLEAAVHTDAMDR